MTTRRSTTKKKSLEELIIRHGELTLEIAFIEAVIETSNENFVHHDGLEPKSLVVTSDGRRVPEGVVSACIEEIKSAVLAPRLKELEKLKKVKV